MATLPTGLGINTWLTVTDSQGVRDKKTLSLEALWHSCGNILQVIITNGSINAISITGYNDGIAIHTTNDYNKVVGLLMQIWIFTTYFLPKPFYEYFVY